MIKIFTHLLTIAVNFRKSSLLFLSSFFLINCYLMLFNQQIYITFLEFFSPDGNISDINTTFLKIQAPIIWITVFFFLIEQRAINQIEGRSQSKTNNNESHKIFFYIVACILWLFVSYYLFLFSNSKAIINAIKEEGFYQNCGTIFLLVSSILFFYLFYSKKGEQPTINYHRRNTWFLLLSLLFFFGAGEEVSWGQRFFNFQTPEFMSSNIQNEFSIHNLPWFDARSEKPYLNDHGVVVNKMKSGFIATHLTSSFLMSAFCMVSLVILPFLNIINCYAHKFITMLRLPIASLYFGMFFIIETIIHNSMQHYYHLAYIKASQNQSWNLIIENSKLLWATDEIHETFVSFLFMIISFWFIRQTTLTKKMPAYFT